MEEIPMKRIAFAAAAAALVGTGCISSSSSTPPPPQVGSVNLYWSFVRTAPAQALGRIDYDTTYRGTAIGPCAQSAVDSVTVDSAVGQVEVDCVTAGQGGTFVQGLGIDGLPAGPQTFRFRGWRGSVLVYDSIVTRDVHAGMVMDYYVAMQGVSAPLDLFAYLSYGVAPGTLYASCAAAGSPNIGFEIKDVVFGTVVDSGLVGCSDPLPATVFVGDLELDDFDVRMRGYEVPGGALVFDSCDVPLAHFAGQIGGAGLAPVLRTLPVPVCN
jgi:hypothetical protein